MPAIRTSLGLALLASTSSFVPAIAQEAAPALTLQLLHASDLEGNADAVENAPNFAAIVDRLRQDYDTTLVLSAGDNLIPSPFSNAAGAPDPQIARQLSEALTTAMRAIGHDVDAQETATGRFDIAAMDIIGFDASAIGNHEFDFGQGPLLGVLAASDTWVGASFPLLSANLVVGPQSPLRAIYKGEGLSAAEEQSGVIAPFAVLEANGTRFGVIGITTPLLATISSPGGDPSTAEDDVTTEPTSDDIDALAAVVQPFIDELTGQGLDKIIITSHLQQAALEQELAGKLSGVDIIIAGGSDTRLADDGDILREGDDAQGPYPILTEDADGAPVAIVSTDGQYSYVGRLVIGFDDDGKIMPTTIDPAISGAFATDEAGVLRVTGAAELAAAIDASPPAATLRDLVTALSDAVLTASGQTYFADLAVDLNGSRGPGVRTEETNLGSLTADANLAAARALTDDEVLISLKNGGGIRASIPRDDGKVSELEIQQALAFNNSLSLITLTPEQLVEALEHGVAESTFSDDGVPSNTPGRFPQVGGLSFTFDPARPAGGRIVALSLTGAGPDGGDVTLVEDGALTDAAADYADGIRAVTLSFLVTGGDGYPFPAFVEADAAFADVVDLIDTDVVADGAAQFTNVGTEQDAFAEYLAAMEGPVDMADTPAAEDTRIRNTLAQ